MTIRSTFAGLAFGTGAGLVHRSCARAFGDAPDAQALLLFVAGIGFVAGLLPAERARAARLPSPPSARISLLLLSGFVALATWFARPLGAAVASLGGGLDSHPIGVALARALVSAPFLLPASWITGALVRHATRPAGVARPRFAAFAVAGVIAGLACVAILGQRPVLIPFAGAITAISIAAVGWLGAFDAKSRRPAPPEKSDGAAAPHRPSEPTLLAFAIAVAAAAWFPLAPRLVDFAAGSDLDGLPIAALVMISSCALGALAGAVLPGLDRVRPSIQASIALAAAAVFVLARWPLYDDLVSRFAEWRGTNLPFGDFVGNAWRRVASMIAPVGALLGFAVASSVRDLPARVAAGTRERFPFLVRTSAAATIGALVGSWLLDRGLAGGRLEGAITASAIVTGVLAAGALVFPGRPTLPRAFAALALACAVLGAARFAPVPDRALLQVERNILPARELAELTLKNWLAFDEDGRDASRAIVRRGHAKRLLVNGRFVASNESVKTHGLLAHLPLLLHSSPRNVVVLGSGNGLALGAALAHPVERVDCFETGRTPIRATAQLGSRAAEALVDERLGIHLGDLEDLLARSRRTDVILSQVSGTWDDRAAQTSTREFLRLAKSRLAEGGLVCHWIPDSAVTKDGFLILLATFADVFPQVEVWAGQGGDVLVLARASKASLDAGRVVERYRSLSETSAASLKASWIEEPISLLSCFLASDATVRRICATARPHSKDAPRLGLEETARRNVSKPVNPVPGLAALGDDIVGRLTGSLGPGFDEALRRGVRARALEREGAVYEADRKRFDAIEAYGQALELNPFDGSVRRSLAMLRTRMGVQYAQDGTYLAAHNNFRAAVQIDSTYAQGFSNLGGLLSYTGPANYALSVTDQALRLEPDDDLTWALMGKIRRKQGLYAEALPCFQRALEINPRNVDAALGYADAKLEVSETPDVAEAVRYLESYLAIDPENPVLLDRVGKYRDALRTRTVPEAPEGAERFFPPAGFLDPGTETFGLEGTP